MADKTQQTVAEYVDSIPKFRADDLQITSDQLQELLNTAPYRAFKRLDYQLVPEHLMDGVEKQDDVVTFGQELMYLFDNLAQQLGRLPTQKEYLEAGMPYTVAYWKEHQYTNPKINGYPYTKGVELGCKDRIARTYSSKIIELQLELILKELGFKVYTNPLLDTIAGVDIVAEDDSKRYYIHVTTSSRGVDQALKAVRKKEKRGKFLIGSSWVNYGRDFRNDLVICYDSRQYEDSPSTQWANNNPLLKKGFVEEFMALRKLGNKGELLSSNRNKLQDFADWAKAMLKVDIMEEVTA